MNAARLQIIQCIDCCNGLHAGKKVVRALYDYEPSAVSADDETENDLRFNTGDVMVIIRE